jgi:hypothetical protein
MPYPRPSDRSGGARGRRCRPDRVRPGIVSLTAVAMALLLCCGRAPAPGQGGDLSVSISVLVEEGRITAKEPVLARITLSNRGDAPTQIALSDGRTSYLHLQVLDDKGKAVGSTPLPEPAGGFTAAAEIPPGEDRTRLLIVSGLYCFEHPGRYTVVVQVLAPRNGLPVRCEASAPLEVLPFDAARLDARCAELLKPCWKHSGLGELDVGCRTKALYSVRDDTVLPYLDWIAREWAARYACRAIKRLGTGRARRLLETLAARTDRVGEAARNLPQIADFRMWDVEYP